MAEEHEEGAAVEDLGKAEDALGLIEGNRPEDVRRLAQAEGVYPWLNADQRPGPMQGAVLPEAGLVFEDNYPSAARRFFLIAGSRTRSQYSWASASARARRLRGRCTEKPS